MSTPPIRTGGDANFEDSVMSLMDRPFALFDERPLDAFTTDPFESVRRNLHGAQQQFERFNRHVFDDPFFRHGPSRLLREGFFSDEKEEGDAEMEGTPSTGDTKETEDPTNAGSAARMGRVYKMQSMSSTRDGETISESRQQYWDSNTGYKKEANERTINDMGHRFVIEHDPKTKKPKRTDEYRGIEKEKGGEFEKLWQEGVKRHTEGRQGFKGGDALEGEKDQQARLEGGEESQGAKK